MHAVQLPFPIGIEPLFHDDVMPTTQQYCSRGFEQLYSILITHFIRLILLFIIFIRWADKQSRRQKIYE